MDSLARIRCFIAAAVLVLSSHTILGAEEAASALPREKSASAGQVSTQTQAEQLLVNEDGFQKRVAGLSQVVDMLDRRISEMRLQTSPPAQDEVRRIEQDLSLSEQESQALLSLGSSPLAQLQRSQLQDRIFGARALLDTIKQRWGDGWTVFGLDFFQTSAQSPVPDQRPAPVNYKLRSGDKIRVLVASSLGAQNDYEFTVDATGGFFVPGAGRVAAAGKTSRQIEHYIASKLASRFKQLRVEVSIVRVASIQIQVAGDVAKPGTYLMPGMSTLIGALSQAGGPNKSGTLRKVVLSRDGSAERLIDLYDFLLHGNRGADVDLRDGDLIFVPAVGDTIVIGGEVTRPGRYEPAFPITLAQALKMAGGAKSSGYLQTVQVERVENGRYRVLLSQPLASTTEKAQFRLQPGDEVTVSSVREDRTNQVSISGPVKAPGVFGLSEGMRVADLVALAQGLAADREVYMGRADIVRVDPIAGVRLITVNLEKALAGQDAHNAPLSRLDRLFVYEPDQVVFRPRMLSIAGAVARPGSYRRTDGMRVSDAVAAAGGLLPRAHLTRADLVRYQEGDITELVRVDLERAMSGDPTNDVVLSDRDELMVYAEEQVTWRDHTVRIEGAVQRPGVYTRSKNMRLSDLIFAAGGTLPEAGSVAEVARPESGGKSAVMKIDLTQLAASPATDAALEDRDVVTVAAVNPYNRTPAIVYITGEVANPGPYALQNEGERLESVIRRAGGVTSFANPKGALFLRQREIAGDTQQTQDVELILRKSRVFADKQFLTQLARMGVKLPEDFMQSSKGTLKTEEPVKVVSETKLESVTGSAEESMSEPGAKSSSIQSAAANAEPSAMGGPISRDTASGVFEGTNKFADVVDSTRVSIDIPEVLANPSSHNNISLRNGDRIYIPRSTDTVTVVGAVLHPHAFAAATGAKADYYIHRSGGYAPDAATKYTIVVRANGDALPMEQAGRVEPGDVVVVPTAGLIDVTRRWEKAGGVTKVISDILSSAFILTRF